MQDDDDYCRGTVTSANRVRVHCVFWLERKIERVRKSLRLSLGDVFVVMTVIGWGKGRGRGDLCKVRVESSIVNGKC